MIKKSQQPKIIVILGPTASGKSDLAVSLAQKYDGEILSADSRQVYTGLDIGTGKITKKEMQGIPHHMLDVISPKKTFTVQEFKDISEKIIEDILKRHKVPIICGGTGFYIQAIVDNITFPNVPPNQILRRKLQHKTSQQLFLQLKKLDPVRAQAIDKHNPVRLMRAIEIALTLGNVPKAQSKPRFNALQIGIQTDDKKLKEKIHTRLLSRFEAGMIEEAEKLHRKGVSWKRMLELGLEYRYLALYLTEKISKEEMIQKLETEIWHYAKRQKVWFKRDKRIKWVTLAETKKIEKEINSFLKK